MKRLLILGMSAVVGSAMSFSALANPSLYGKANVSLQTEDGFDDQTDSWKLRSNASRLGVKGKEEITDGLSAIYKLEYEVYFDDGDDGDDNAFKQRNIYAGLQSAYGTLIAGKFDTPFKVAQGKFDQFNDLEIGDIKNTLMGENRTSNIIMYSSPKLYNLVKLNAAFIPGEETDRKEGASALTTPPNGGAATAADRPVRDEIVDSSSFSVELGDSSYKDHMFFAAVAYDNEMESEWRGRSALDGKFFMDAVRGSAGVKLGDLKLAAIAQKGKQSDSNPGRDDIEHDGYGVSAAYGIGKVTLKAQYLQSSIDVDDNAGARLVDEELDQWSLGADYKLSKRTKAFAYYAKVESDIKEDTARANEQDDADTFGMGLEVKFGD